MKKFYSLLAVLAIGTAASAQCTINQSVFTSATDYSIHPDTVTNIPAAWIGTGYTTDLQFHVQPDTVTSFGTFQITQITIDSITGVPANFSYLPNPSSGIFPGGSYGCVGVTGLAQAGQENGGPNNDGVYPIVVYYTATVDVFSALTPFPASKSGYKLHIYNPNSVQAIETPNFAVAQNNPNPSNLSTAFNISAPNSGMVQVKVYNLLGSEMKSENIAAAKGTNAWTLETAGWAEGVYLCSFRMGNAVVIRRITVAH
jgi:hypothetical protein